MCVTVTDAQEQLVHIALHSHTNIVPSADFIMQIVAMKRNRNNLTNTRTNHSYLNFSAPTFTKLSDKPGEGTLSR
jgi:hypothetical protein